MQKCVEKMCAIKDELAQETANLQQSKHQIEEAIRSLEDKTEQDVLWYYYIRGMTFERMSYSSCDMIKLQELGTKNVFFHFRLDTP